MTNERTTAGNSTLALWRGSASKNSGAFNIHSAFRKVNASNPTKRKAAKRCSQLKITEYEKFRL